MSNDVIAKKSASMTKDTMPFDMFMSNEAVKKKIWQIVGGKQGQQFITSIVSAVQNNPTLKECTNTSIFTSALLGASLNLSPSPQLGQFYMVPFNNSKKGCKEAQFQLGYKGYIQLAIRSGQYKKINVLAIKDGELNYYDPLNEEIDVTLIDDEIKREETNTIGYYAMFEYTNGFRKAMYWSKEKMMKHADEYSKAFSLEGYKKLKEGKVKDEDMWKYSSFWYKDFDGMAYKTMLRQLISKWGIMSIDMQTAYENDMAVINEDGSKDYVDNTEDSSLIIEQTDIDEVEEKQTNDNTQESTPKAPIKQMNLSEI